MKRSDAHRPGGFGKSRTLKVVLTTLYVLLIVSLVLVVGAIGVGAGIVSAMVKDEKIRTREDFEKDLNSLFQNSYAYFRNKDKDNNPVRIGAFRNDGDVRKLIKSLDDVSPHLIDAFIAIEDRKFYEHNGIVPKSLLRAAWQQATNAEVTTGGSTITQQLVKNVILKNFDKDLERKAKEIVLAIRLDSMFEKDDILVYYMNSAFFGNGANRKQRLYGVQAAAQGLFNRDAKDLHLAQAAYIAGMVQRPNSYNPFFGKDGDKNLERGLKRMKMVLDAMLETEKITQAQYEEALKFDIKKSLAKPDHVQNSYANYPFLMYALEQEAAEILMEKDGLSIEELSKQGKYRSTLEEYIGKVKTRGYHIYSTIDKNMYDAVVKEATKGLRFRTRTYEGRKLQEQLGAVVIDNKTGDILAFVSSTTDDDVDHAFTSRQPGSTIKPLLVYAPAIEEKVISPNTIVVDEELPKADGSGIYKNSNNKYKGPVRVTEALKWSYNIPAIKVFRKLGFENGFEYLRQLGLPPHPKDTEASAIGGMTRGYSVSRMTAAFASLANGGVYHKPHLINKITDSDGNVIWERKQEPQQIFSPQTAYQVTTMLKSVVRGGTGTYIGSRIPGYEIAGKTGTTQNDKDKWFIGYTPQVTIGVWSGYDIEKFTLSHNTLIAQQAWVNIFKAAAAASPQWFDKSARFTNPGGLFWGVPCLDCDRLEQWKKKEEEQKQKEEEEKRKREGEPPNGPGDQPGHDPNDSKPSDRPPGGDRDDDGNGNHDNPIKPQWPPSRN
ncbi:transglycosylase domain-containing protein [Staphylospora marina]|uniref:transglycosylase domain-containing protein n=1 Tax=Staphylospora marina TaxID=2490858 RepID=UPI000F5C1391|nr:transglycosylase domain-containing protein [Staphylospora marina]